MEKTTIETMKSVIQDWLGQCNNLTELYQTHNVLLRELENQFMVVLKIKHLQLMHNLFSVPNPCVIGGSDDIIKYVSKPSEKE